MNVPKCAVVTNGSHINLNIAIILQLDIIIIQNGCTHFNIISGINIYRFLDHIFIYETWHYSSITCNSSNKFYIT